MKILGFACLIGGLAIWFFAKAGTILGQGLIEGSIAIMIAAYGSDICKELRKNRIILRDIRDYGKGEEDRNA